MVRQVRSLVRAGLVVLVGACLGAALAQDSYQQRITLPNGETAMIDWSAGQLRATGLAVAPSNVESDAQGQVLARRGAILDAQRMLIEVIGGVQLDAETTMLNAMANDVVRSRVEGAVQGAVVQDEQWDGDIFTVTLEVPLEAVTVPPPPPPAPTAEAPTGLVIDARDFGVTPALRVDVYDDSGQMVLASVTALYNPSLPGLAGDAGDDPVDDAASADRMGASPFVVAATGVRENRVDLVISTVDGARLLSRIGGDPRANPFTVRNSFIIAN